MAMPSRPYPPGVAEPDSVAEPEPWGEDPKLVELLGAPGASGFRALFDGFPEAVGLLWALRDADGRIVDFTFGYGNPSILRAFRLPAATKDRYTLLEALPTMRGASAFDAYVQVCESGEPWVQEVTYDTPFGDGYMLGTFVQRTAKLGDGLVNFLTDVTAQRRMESELGSFADVVAHDLNEPIAASRCSSGCSSGAPSTAAATLEVGELPEVEVDPRQLRRVLQNLLGNAVKYRGEAPRRVELTALRDSQEWVVTMRDNGLGVDPEKATRIFDMFARANDETDGVGIGLAVCRRIIEAHGGRIWAEAPQGGGSAFRFTLPR
jgi:Histidine kinase-, DNA gyrase B-, and HSP90-like ATPase